MSILGVDVPPIYHVTIWGSGPLGINKTAVIYLFSALAAILLFVLGTRKKQLVPSGLMQNTAESGVDFVRNQVILQTIGPDGMRFLPFLTTMFFFIFFSNITEIIPGVQFPANARIAMPMVLAITVWFIYMIVGIVKQGPFNFLKNSVWPPGVPLIIKVTLVAPIEFVSVFFVRPLSLAIRLFANMLAGHLILVTFAALCAGAWALSLTAVVLLGTFPLLVAMTGFEVLVSFLQAFIFTILTAVYIGSSMHPDH